MVQVSYSTMAYSYTPLQDTEKPVRRDRIWAARALCFGTVVLVAVTTWWLQSHQRQVMIDVYRLSCRKVPWYFFPAPGAEVFFEGSDHYIPSVDDSWSNSTSQPEHSQRRRISHLQACSYAYAGHDYLSLLVDNHKQYCRTNGIEYVLRTGRGEGVWLKIVAAREKLEQELKKEQDQRAEWIL